MNPGLNAVGLSDDRLIDLYLRRYAIDVVNWDTKWEMRNYFGFDTDMYVANSIRERDMEAQTDAYVLSFLLSLVGSCEIDWSQPDDGSIISLLTE